jgi:EAL domain-containing protein (putative c-di-GMP-specific phosphodiesterase class I)
MGVSLMSLTEIQAALAGAMVETRYQPVVRLADRVPVGLEALARLNHPVRGTLLPEAFVPQMEDAGLADQLTDRVVACAFADMTGAALAPLGLSVSLNFPLDVLVGTTALARLDTRRQAAGIPIERVVIELTESQPVHDMPALRGAVEHLRRTGYQIVIDDVSPAVAGLDQLLHLPFTGIKLDQHLVHQLTADPDAVAEVERIIRIARLRELTVVAEGIESVAQWHQLRALGVEQAQGFLVAHALSAAAVPTWLKSWGELPAF